MATLREKIERSKKYRLIGPGHNRRAIVAYQLTEEQQKHRRALYPEPTAGVIVVTETLDAEHTQRLDAWFKQLRTLRYMWDQVGVMLDELIEAKDELAQAQETIRELGGEV